MATYTTNYNWTKPALNDPVDITVLNGNLDSQDDIIHEGFSNLADADNDIYAVMGQMGAKNLIPYPYAYNSQTISTVVFTVNDDGTIKANGTASADIKFYIHYRGNMSEESPCIIKNGTYIFNGCPTAASLTTFRIGLGRTHNGAYNSLGEDFGTGCTITLNGDDYSADRVHLAILISIKKNAVLNNVIFKPMLRLASDTDDTYHPYAKTNKQLTDELATITPHILPDVPSSDGDYSLKLSIADGVPTYSWESVTP